MENLEFLSLASETYHTKFWPEAPPFTREAVITSKGAHQSFTPGTSGISTEYYAKFRHTGLHGYVMTIKDS